jgi:outer membrane biosynthesis protein TonB
VQSLIKVQRLKYNLLMHHRLALLALVAVLATGASGCARAQARSQPVLPPLTVPEPPPRSIAPPEPEPEEPAEPAVAASSPATSRPVRRPPSRPPAAKPETQKEEAAKPDTVVGRPDEAADLRVEGGPALSTPQTANQAEVERKVRDLLDRAGRTLNGVNYRALNADARSQYDTAKRFIQQAETAIKDRNFVFATYLADKADTLARGLLGR